MRKIFGLFIAIGSLMPGACSTLTPESQPAILVNPNAQTKAELTATVSKALNGANITLAPYALTTTNTLIIERAQHRSIGQGHMMGRMTERPDHFNLQITGKACILTHEESGEMYVLETARCKMIGV